MRREKRPEKWDLDKLDEKDREEAIEHLPIGYDADKPWQAITFATWKDQ
jgi:hypothetical protein